MVLCPHCERLTTAASDACFRCGSGRLEPVRSLGRTYSVRKVAVYTALLIDLVALGGLAAVFYGTRVHDPMGLAAFESIVVLEEVVAMGLFLNWLYRSVRNIEALTNGQESVSAAWSVGSWFVPGCNLIVPLRAVWQVIVEELSSTWAFPVTVTWWTSFVSGSLLNVWMWFQIEPTPAEMVVAKALLAIAGLTAGWLVLHTSWRQQIRLDRALARRAALAHKRVRTSS